MKDLTKEEIGDKPHGNTKHGGKGTPLYDKYNAMKTRCYSATTLNYKQYGARGIKVCDRWLNGEEGKHGFECFVEDMGEMPNPKHSIERIDNNGNYRPDNCRWATVKEQSRNRRSNRKVMVLGEEMVLIVACEQYNINPNTAWYRLDKGWSEDDVFTKPIDETRKKK